jgi:hypothetical protein
LAWQINRADDCADHIGPVSAVSYDATSELWHRCTTK